MILRLTVFAMLLLGLAGFGTIAWLGLNGPPAPEAAVPAMAAPHPAVLAAAAALRAGVLLKPEDVGAATPDRAPAGARADTPALRAELTGAMLRRSLEPGEVILPADIMRPGDHGFLAAVLGPGRRAATVAVDAVTGSAGLIWPGDRVDLLLTQAMEDSALPAGRRFSGETLLPDLRVIAIDQQLARGVQPTGGDSQNNRTVTLEVTPRQAETIAVASRLGKLSLVVRAADPTLTAPDPAGEPGFGRVTWAGDVSPALGGGARPGATMRVFQGSSESKEFRF